ncbi:diphosphoinositol polyphosphate phosphohydrolase Ddp1p [Trichomonascus vanleenenianus]|uniref:polyphosphatase DDP1 n=1 Tax=Trichomonascus vanleenenianus TaxID=2268995 RepID=UPI003EC96C3C
MTARVGRDRQVYSEKTGARMVAGTVVLNHQKDQVLLVSSAARPDCWVLPKGGIESDEASPEVSALRETWEEAGAIGKIVRSLGIIEDNRPPKTWKADTVQGANATWPPRSEFHFFEMEVERLEADYPEADSRKREWMGFSQATAELLRHNRPELAEAISRSSLKRDLS